MRFEIVNTITGKSTAVHVEPPRNPIRVGSDPDKMDVVLASGYVSRESFAISRDNHEDHWTLWNMSAREISVGETPLNRLHDKLPLANGTLVTCYPFQLRILFDRQELATDADSSREMDDRCAELVHDIHRSLLEIYANSPRSSTDKYIMELEQKIEELIAGRPDFPTDDMAQTQTAQHLAGVAVRSELIHQLISASGDALNTFDVEKDLTGWDRLRTAIPDLENELRRYARWGEENLKLARYNDLTSKMAEVESGYWPLWQKLTKSGKGLPTRVSRYFALRRLKEEIKDLWFGFGPLEDLLEDPTITEIMVVDREHIFVEKHGMIENSGRRFVTDPMTIIEKIVNGAEREINTSSPMADARMPDGSRVNAIVPPLALKGPSLTIRRFPKKRKTIEDLIERHQTLTRASRSFLEAAVINRRNIMVSGGTGTGKTTLLNCLSSFIPDKERIVTIEDTAELQLQKEHVVTLQAKQKNAEGRGEVAIRDLVRNALRMRPDRIIVGECRGGEAIDMLQAMNTGHDGSMTTIHANSPLGVIQRLEVLVQQNNDTRLPVESIHRQIVSAIDLIVQLTAIVIETPTENGIRRERRRVVSEIAEVVDVEEGGGVRIVPLFARRRDGLGELRPTGYLPTFIKGLLEDGLIESPESLVRGEVTRTPGR